MNRDGLSGQTVLASRSPYSDVVGQETNSDAVLLVILTPTVADVPEFNDWYDNDHVPARVVLDGIRTARRYRALTPSASSSEYLAYYDLDSSAVLDSPGYQQLRQHQDPREQRVVGATVRYERWVLQRVSLGPGSHEDDVEICGHLLQCTYWTPATEPSAADQGWLGEEYIRRTMAAPGVLRMRRLALVEGSGPAYVDMHDLHSAEALFDHRYEAVQQEWLERQGATAERQLYQLYRRFDETAS